MSEWKVLEDPRMGDIFGYLERGWEVETSCTSSSWKPVNVGRRGTLLRNGYPVSYENDRQWRVREPGPKWLDCGITGAMNYLDGGYRVQVAYDDNDGWYDVCLGRSGDVKYKAVNRTVPVNSKYQWRYQEKEVNK